MDEKKNSQNNNKKEKTGNGFKFRYCLYIAVALLVLLSLFSHKAGDFAIIEGGSDDMIGNWIGSVGAHLSCFLLYMFGIAAYPLTILLVICALRPLLPFPTFRRGYSGALLAIFIGTTVLFAVSPQSFSDRTSDLGIGRKSAPAYALSGGVIGQVLASPSDGEIQPGYVRRFIGTVGTVIVAMVFLLAGLIFLWLADWHVVARAMLSNVPAAADAVNGLASRIREREAAAAAANGTAIEGGPDPEEDEDESRSIGSAREALLRLRRQKVTGQEDQEDEPEDAEPPQAEDPEPVIETPVPLSSQPLSPSTHTADGKLNDAAPDTHTTVKGQEVSAPKRAEEFIMPPITMLGKGPEASGESVAAIDHAKEILQQTLESFNIDGHVTGYVSGPRVTRYEISLSPGIKVEKVANIGNNIAMELEAQSIRILAPIPGKNAVGVEAPNSKAQAVFLRSLMETDTWKRCNCEIPIVLGKDVSGKPIILDLAKAPHLLIAGATGSGKSVCMNTLIMSLLFKFNPEELRMILVDPKVVEMEMYSSLPHLITPVVNDPQKVPVALRWAVNEMEKRYRILAKARVKNLKGYNSRTIPQHPVLDADGKPIPDKLPVLVIIVDELADVMMTDAKSDVETSIARIAQKGRAAGVHIVIATQRPSTNIITGVIKANLPTRIAFRVGSIVDSRVILDQKGAETLLGRGDMLFIPPGSANLDRIQGAMVADEDIEKVVDFVAGQAEQEFDNKVVSEEDENGTGASSEASISDAPEIDPIIKKYLNPGDDDLMRRALEIILLERKASTSYLQRRLKIGYNRSAELIDMLEDRGIVGPPGPGGSKREILVFDEIENS
ncbi:DNA translocase FtsK [Lentisphaerota bacterium ZTH]|nr:DNA translocase FtsK [Lentisphaerota bacterium]WET05288.1 DNA translocase FtsK [Lentisphaerota bacterium ZTH]